MEMTSGLHTILQQSDMFRVLSECSLEMKIKMSDFSSKYFAVCYTEEPLREWPEISPRLK